MKKKRFIIWITVILTLAFVTSAFAYGKAKAESAEGQNQKSYFDTLNDYDWTKTCPGASCRSRNAE